MIAVIRNTCMLWTAALLSLPILGVVAADNTTEGKWIGLPQPARLCVMPAEYQMPFTQRGMQERINAKLHLFRENSQGGVYLKSDQVLGLSGEGSGGLEFLRGIPGTQLRLLRLVTPAITDQGIIELRRCAGLRQLSLNVDRVDNMSDVLAALPQLELFSISSPLHLNPANAPDRHFFSNEQFKLFASTPEMRCLHISSRLLSDEAIRLAVKIPKLEVLGIRGTRLITDEGFVALVEADQLKELVLEAGPKCTDAGIRQLMKLKHLEWIEIYGMAKIDDSTRDALKARFPNAEIRFKPLVGP